MSDDIVARMRQTHAAHCKCVGCEAANEIERLREERDEISIHADVIIKEASALITRCVESRKASAYWNAVEQFRQFESRTT